MSDMNQKIAQELMKSEQHELPEGFRPRYGGANWAYDMGLPEQYPKPTAEQMVQAGLLMPGPWTAVGAGAGALALGSLARSWPGMARIYGPMSALGTAAKESAALLGGGAGVGYMQDLSFNRDRLSNWDGYNKELARQSVDVLNKTPIPGRFNYNDPWLNK